jgi:hypothetical protein
MDWLDKKSVRKIALEQKLNPRTVRRVLSQEALHQEVQTHRSALLELLPDAVNVYRHVLRGGKGPIDLAHKCAQDVIRMAAIPLPKDAADTNASIEDTHTEDEILHCALFGRYPTEQELQMFHDTGRWPAEELLEQKTITMLPMPTETKQ